MTHRFFLKVYRNLRIIKKIHLIPISPFHYKFKKLYFYDINFFLNQYHYNFKLLIRILLYIFKIKSHMILE